MFDPTMRCLQQLQLAYLESQRIALQLELFRFVPEIALELTIQAKEADERFHRAVQSYSKERPPQPFL
jgi:hypothetical protein